MEEIVFKYISNNFYNKGGLLFMNNTKSAIPVIYLLEELSLIFNISKEEVITYIVGWFKKTKKTIYREYVHYMRKAII